MLSSHCSGWGMVIHQDTSENPVQSTNSSNRCFSADADSCMHSSRIANHEYCARTACRIVGSSFRNAVISGMLTTEMVKSMNRDPIIFAMANPVPEIMPDLAKKAGAAVVGTGRSDFPNQINNVLAFPGIFRGALDVRAKDINEEMKLAAAEAIASLVSDEELSADYILPMAFDDRVGKTVAAAVAQAARTSGVARN